jgi:hypothetical protein
MTAPYRINEKTREIYKDEVLISTINPKNLKGAERKIFNHELVYLNPNYRGKDTPQNYRDWLDLIHESIHHPESPQINLSNEGIKRATEIIQQENISAEEWEQAKIEVGKRKVIKLAIEEQVNEIVKNMLADNETDEKITKYTGLTLEQIQELRRELDR